MNGQTVGRPMQILLVDDSLTDAKLACHALAKANFEHRLSVLVDGQDALEFLHRVGKYVHAPTPDLMLLDLRLPKVDGLDVLADIRQHENLEQMPVVIMTSSEDEADRQECQAAKVDAFLTKPVKVQEFLTVVRQLRHHWQHEELILPADI